MSLSLYVHKQCDFEHFVDFIKEMKTSLFIDFG